MLMDNFKIIYKILSVLEKSMDLENVDTERISSNNLGISQQRWDKYMEMLLDAGYIKGVSIKKYTDGEMRVGVSGIFVPIFKKGKVKNYDESNVITANGWKNR